MVHAEVVEGHLHELTRGLGGIAAPVILRVEDPPDLALPVAHLSGTDPHVPDYASAELRSKQDAITVSHNPGG